MRNTVPIGQLCAGTEENRATVLNDTASDAEAGAYADGRF